MIPSNPDEWAALFLLLLVIGMAAPSLIDKLWKKMRPSATTEPDPFFDVITEFQNDFK